MKENKLNQWRALNMRVARTKQNFNKGKYAPLEEILEKINGPLSKIGIVLTHKLLKEHEDDHYHLCSTLTDATDGTELGSTCFPVSAHPDPQKVGAGITYARRYNICVLLDIAADDDDDGEAASTASKQKTYKAPKAKPLPADNSVDEETFQKALIGLADPKKDSLNIIKWLDERALTEDQEHRYEQMKTGQRVEEMLRNRDGAVNDVK